MKNVVILGSGAGGTMIAAKLRQELDEADWRITIIDKHPRHDYQPGWLFVPFGIYTARDCAKPKSDFIMPGVDLVLDEVVNVDPGKRTVKTRLGQLSYDWLVIATGCRIMPEEIDGMMDDWGGNVHTFYTIEGAVALQKKMKYFESGRVVFNIAELPFKCPVAPLEFIYMADWFFRVNGVRDNVEIELVTPLAGAFTKPVSSKALGKLCEQKNIKISPNFDLAQVNAGEKTIESHLGNKVPYDLLVSIPPNFGAQYIIDSGIGDPIGYMNTDHFTLQAKDYDRIYVIGDATNVPTSKAGSVAHYQSETVVENLVREIDGYEPKPTADGHSTCFIVTGFEKASLIDFNYTVEPLEGKFPFPGFGPFDLLGDTHLNYWGKMMFKWVYWNLMMKGLDFPLEPQMTMAGKINTAEAVA
ncbi:MAG: NAD(P)/FAD-dependent oxidoreductase [Deltaproteobacteria bacterium]|nr:NAD(P)/FAD-dependent oxidoreductase [Deltaproteobacteria bacterium]MBW2053112.1 NAD(P)/FAD-dependent oxidoreductase [Deltaproteobacteria bacterium]MBW2323717.1 NAD(P)/FAD-dependent oxidoreductase [Deltaproteobacteria bacterium]